MKLLDLKNNEIGTKHIKKQDPAKYILLYIYVYTYRICIYIYVYVYMYIYIIYIYIHTYHLKSSCMCHMFVVFFNRVAETARKFAEMFDTDQAVTDGSTLAARRLLVIGHLLSHWK